MQPKKFSEYTPITETDGSEVIPILKAGVNATVKSEDLPISTATQTAIDAADADIAAHIADVANPHEVTKAQVGLGNADNTSDANKPVSTAQATAIALKADQSTTYTKTEVDTKDTAVADTAQTNLTAHTSNTSNPHATTKAQVGLANADNTSDVDKPISAATQTALDAKATNTALDAHTNDTSNPHSVTKTQVGLGNVDNTSDINKPVSTAQATADAAVASTAASSLSAHTSNTSNPHSVTKSQVGLGNADNTSDASKPVSTAQQAAIDAATFINPYTVPFRNNSAAGPANDFIAVGQTAATANSMVRRTSTGAVFAATATDNNHAVNKAQMDTADALKVAKTGDTMTGRLANATSNLSTSNTRGGKEILFGATSVGNFGVLNNTDSLEVFNVMADGSGMRLGTSVGLAFLKGTGFPEGVVSAPVGSTYIDTNATNGAIQWYKATGTGNTGWQVSIGDTGWRDITSDFTNLEVINVNDYGVYIKRSGNTVTITIKAQLKGTWVDGVGFTLPTGFRVGPGSAKKGNFYAELLQVAGAGRVQTQISGTFIFVSGTVTTAGARYYGSISMPARSEELWPSTLPGTAV